SFLKNLLPKNTASEKIQKGYDYILGHYNGEFAAEDIEAVLNKPGEKIKPVSTLRLKIYEWEHFNATFVPNVKATLRTLLAQPLKKSAVFKQPSLSTAVSKV